jgi:sulfite exporter TauE/SafE
MPKSALFAVMAASIYLLLRGAGIINDANFVVWAQAALFGVFLLATGVSVKAGNAMWAAIFAALAIGWNPWVKLSAWHQPLPWDKWATAMSLLCGATAGAFVVRYWGRGETA